MHRAYRYTLRLGQRARFRRRLTAGVLATCAASALAAVWMAAPERVRAASMHASEPVQSGTRRDPRVTHPYPVVAGGVASRANQAGDVARFLAEAQDPGLELLAASFAQAMEEADGGLADAGTARARTFLPSVPTAGPIRAASGRAPVEASGPALSPRIGDLRNMGFVSTGWAGQPGTNIRSGIAADPARGSAPPEEAPAADPAPFLPQPDPSRPPRTDSTLADAPQPAEVPEPGTRWLLAAALSALLALRRKG